MTNRSLSPDSRNAAIRDARSKSSYYLFNSLTSSSPSRNVLRILTWESTKTSTLICCLASGAGKRWKKGKRASRWWWWSKFLRKTSHSYVVCLAWYRCWPIWLEFSMSLKLNLRKIDVRTVKRTVMKAKKRVRARGKYERKKISK